MNDENKKQENHNLKKLKEKYEELRKKYALPEFKFLNENFEIEDTEADSELIIKKIRKQIVEKMYSYLRTLEAFINPQNAPIFVFNIIKSLDNSDLEIIKKLYNQLAEFEIEAFGLESFYEEKEEIEFIKKVSKVWPEIAQKLNSIYKTLKKNFNSETEKKSKSYLG